MRRPFETQEMLESVEQLRERAFELEFELKRERQQKEEAQSLFEGLRALAFAGSMDDILASTLEQMRVATRSTAALMLRRVAPETRGMGQQRAGADQLDCVSATDNLFTGSRWILDSNFQRVFDGGKAVRLFDLDHVNEWQSQPLARESSYRSALILPLKIPEAVEPIEALLVCLHEQSNYYSSAAAKVACRMAVLAKDGLRLVQNRELALRQRLRQLTNRSEQVRTQLLISAADAIGEGLIVIDRDGRLIVCNDAYRALYAESAHLYQPGAKVRDIFVQEVRAGMILDAVGQEDAWIAQWIDEPASRNFVTDGNPAEHRLRNGRHVRTSARSLPNGWTVGFRLDISALKDNERKLEKALEDAQRANAAKSQFLATVSHEIRTPLNAVIGFLGVLAQEDLAPQQLAYVHTAHDASTRLMTLLNDILDLAKMETGKIELDEEIVVLRDLLDDLQRLFEQAARSKRLTFSVRSQLPDDYTVRADGARLRQILVNLLSNAIKFTDRGAVELELFADAHPNGLCFSVLDSGPGIDPQQQAAVFEPFQQLPHAIQGRLGGTGLGLSIVRELAEAMQGRVGVESRVGEGARFWFKVALPRVARPQLPEQPAKGAPLTATDLPPGLRVLAADDSSSNLMLLQAIFARADVTLDCVHNGAEALTACEQTHYDLLLMDLSMPVMDGFEATASLRAEEQRRLAPALPIIALTAAVMDEERRRIDTAGFTAFVAKPIIEADLVAAMLQAIRQPKATSGQRYDAADEEKTMVPAELLMPEADRRSAVLDALAQFPEQQRAVLARTLLQEFADRLHRLQDALQNEDIGVLALESHAIKGTGASFGLTELAEAAATIETQAKEQPAALDWQRSARFCTLLASTVQSLQAIVAELAA